MDINYHDMVRIAPAALLMLCMSCCGRDEGLPPEGCRPAGAITFAADVGAGAVTRAPVADIEAVKGSGFGVFAYRTGDGVFNPDAAAGFLPDLMCNRKVAWNPGASGTASGTWTYGPVESWPGSKVSFFAYAPYTADPGTAGVTGITGSGDPGSPWVIFRMDSDVDRQMDLLYADSSGTTDLTGGQVVLFRFRHALSRISFRCAVAEVLDRNTTVTVDSVILRMPEAAVAGRLDLCTGEWESLETADIGYTLREDDFITGGNVFTESAGTSPSDLTADDKYLMVIPSDRELPVSVTVGYDVRTADTSLDGGSVTTGNTVTGTFSLSPGKGKSYCLTLRIGMRSVGISAGVTDWDGEEHGWTPVERH